MATITTVTAQTKGSRTLHVALWVAQVALAGMFLMAGWMKVATPTTELVKAIPLSAEMLVLIRVIGAVELLGSVGLILPAALRILPKLTVVAAIGFAIIMVLAIFLHGARGEFQAIVTNVVLGAVAVFVAWGRSRKVPISSK